MAMHNPHVHLLKLQKKDNSYECKNILIIDAKYKQKMKKTNNKTTKNILEALKYKQM